ncbi:MAG: class I SAM-dependent methyltransferase [Gemmatimonadales bacterium]
MAVDAHSFWEDPDRVEEFADREPDRRLLELLDRFEEPGATRVLDLGCAGGRNTVVLAERGFDVQAIDSSSSMVRKTRERVATVLGAGEAERRVRVGRMEDLGEFASGSFHLVVALGVYHNAVSDEIWELALSETARVLIPDGLLLVANFTPGFEPHGEALRRVSGTRYGYEGFEAGPLYLLDADELDAEIARHGLAPVVHSETVETPTDSGRRVTVNALYRKGGP